MTRPGESRRVVPTGPRRTFARGVVVGLASAFGLLVGLRSIAHLEFGGLTPLVTPDGIPREILGLAWSDRAMWPADLQAHALRGLLTVLGAMALAAALVATLNALILLADSVRERRGELAVRSALGASPGRQARTLLRELRTPALAALSLGLVLGLSLGATARLLWPGPLLSVEPTDPADLLVAALALAAVVVWTHVGGGLRSLQRGRGATALRAGTRTGADPLAIFARKALTAGHTTVAATLLVGTLALLGRAGPEGNAPAPESEVVALSVERPEGVDWSEVLARVGEVPGLAAESLATPGTLVGLGVRDAIMTECGECFMGGLPVRFWSVIADHHAVAPGFLDLAGIEIVRGRDFTGADGADAPPVAVVSETFARSSFEDGDPIGRRVHIGADYREPFTVVGVVADQYFAALGREDVVREAVFVSALQQSPRSGTLLLRGTEESVDTATAVLAEMGVDQGAVRSLSEHRDAATAALMWMTRLTLFLALAAVLLTAHGVYEAALQTTRHRRAALGVRRALGADSDRIFAFVMFERLRTLAWGVAGFGFFGPLAVALLQKSIGIRAAGPLDYATVAALLTLVGLLASVRAAGEAVEVDPGTLLR